MRIPRLVNDSFYTKIFVCDWFEIFWLQTSISLGCIESFDAIIQVFNWQSTIGTSNCTHDE